MMAVPDITVTVVWSPGPRRIETRALSLPAGSTLAAALAAAGLGAATPGLRAGVWGRKAEIGQVLRDGDRVEVYRPLRVDPKRARRERFGRQGARSAGLFAQRRPGAKPGY